MQHVAGFSRTLKKFFTFERIFILILLAAILLRFWQPDLKLLHHDEAIHSWFSYELLTKGAWMYDSSYHGPFLYYVTAGMFAAFGSSDLVARLLPCLFGVLLIPLVYCVYRLGYITKAQTLLVSLFIAISPDMVYFSRFLRHDIFMLFFTFLLVVAILYYFERGQARFAVIAAVAAALALCCKEEMPVILLIFVLFFFVSVWQGAFTLPKTWKRDGILGLMLVIAIMSVLYTGFGAHPESIVGYNFQIIGEGGPHFDMKTTGWYQAIDHWSQMHSQQRLGGPWFFYIPLYLLYELPIFALALVGTLQFLFKGIDCRLFLMRAKAFLKSRRTTLPVGDLAAISTRQLQGGQPAITKSDDFFRLCIVWMLLTMMFYAWVGEKVPWLIIPQLLPMCFVATYRLNWQKIIIALAGCLFLLAMTWHVAFVPADINEPIIQVQNSEDMRLVMQLMDASDRIVIASKDYWPLPWYYRGERWNKVRFHGDKSTIEKITENTPDIIILHDTESYPAIDGYEKKTYKLAYWFTFNDNKDRLLEYYIHRDGNPGSINIDVFTMKQGG